MKPTILVLEQYGWQGGAQRVLQCVIEALKSTFEFLVVFPEDGSFAEALRRRQIETAFLPLGSYRPGQKSWSEMLAFGPRSLYGAVRLAALIVKRNIELVYINGPRWLPAGALAARLTHRPSVFHLHLTLHRRAEAWLVSHAARRVSSIIACSATAARSLARLDPRLITKTRVLYSPLIEETNRAGAPRPLPPALPDDRRFTVGFVGRVTEAKGIHVLLKAVTRLPAELRERLQVFLVGEPAPGSAQDRAYHAWLRSCAAAWGLDDQILWAGYQAHLDPYYSAMDVLVAPSLLPEGLHLGILEAMHHGVPVIASRSGGILETVRDGVNGLLVSPGDERALALALERILTDSYLRAQLAQGALTTVDDRFSVETFKRGIREVVLKLHSPVASAGCTVNPEESTVRP